MTLAVLFISFTILIAMGMPIAFCLAISATLAVFTMDLSALVVMQRMFAGINIYALIAIPFFIYSGEIMLRGGAADRIVRFAQSLVGHWRGGLGQVNVLTSLLFGGISGSAVAGVSAVGGVLIPKMKEEGYDGDYAVNVTVAASTLGLVIPPSHNMILYAIAAGGGVSVGTLFVAGIVPGLLTAILLGVVTWLVARRRGYGKAAFAGFGNIALTFAAALPGLGMVLIIVGGIRFGVFTATEASAIAVFYGLIITAIAYRGMGWKSFLSATRHAAQITATVMFIIGAASAFGWVLAAGDAPQHVAAFFDLVANNRIVAFLLMNLILLLLGAIMDMAPLIFITTPIFLPIAQQYGMDPTQFGVMLIMNLGLGLITPPVGTALFVGCSVGGVKVAALLKSIWPFYLAHLVAIMLVTFVPAISLWLTGIMG